MILPAEVSVMIGESLRRKRAREPHPIRKGGGRRRLDLEGGHGDGGAGGGGKNTVGRAEDGPGVW